MKISKTTLTCLLGCIFSARMLAQSGVVGASPEVEEPAAAASQQEQSFIKIDPELKARAERGETLSVLIALSDRLPISVRNEVRSRFASVRLQAVKRTRELGHKSPAAARAAAVDRDAIVHAERLELLRIAESAFAPQQARVSSLITKLGGRALRKLSITNTVEAELPPAAVLALEANPDVVRVVENKSYPLQLLNSNEVLGTPELWARGYLGGTQTVAVLDSGIAADHVGFSGVKIDSRAQLDSAFESGCVQNYETSGEDHDGHGTHVSGIIASQGLARFPEMKGVAFGLGQLVSIQVGTLGTKKGNCPDLVIKRADVLSAIETVVRDTAASVINLSIGAETNLDDDLENWFVDQVADDYDIVFSIAAGNSGRRSIPYQIGSFALSYNAIAVANLDTNGTLNRADDTIAPTSSRGPTRLNRKKPDVAAPGTDIVSLVPGASKTAVEALSGTSMAAPHIAGAAALLFDAGAKGAKEVKALLLNSSDGVGWARDRGYGSANLATAIEQLESVVSSSVATGTSKFYRLRVNGPSRVTLVWNRHIDSIVSGKAYGDFRNLNLAAYDEATYRLAEASNSTLDNVEQVNLTGNGAAILKVSQVGTGPANEAFALALPHANFEELAGPSLKVSCTGDAEVVGSMKVAVRCTAVNPGGLALNGITVKVVAPTGFTASLQPIPTIGPGSSVNFAFEMTTTSQPGLREYAVVVEGSSLGDIYSERVPMAVNVTPIAPQDCTMVVTPPSKSLTLTYHAQSFVVKVSFPRYNPKLPGTCSYDAYETSGWFSLSGAKKGGPAGGEILVTVNQAGRNTINATRAGAFRLRDREDYVFYQYYQK